MKQAQRNFKKMVISVVFFSLIAASMLLGGVVLFVKTTTKDTPPIVHDDIVTNFDLYSRYLNVAKGQTYSSSFVLKKWDETNFTERYPEFVGIDNKRVIRGPLKNTISVNPKNVCFYVNGDFYRNVADLSKYKNEKVLMIKVGELTEGYEGLMNSFVEPLEHFYIYFDNIDNLTVKRASYYAKTYFNENGEVTTVSRDDLFNDIIGNIYVKDVSLYQMIKFPKSTNIEVSVLQDLINQISSFADKIYMFTENSETEFLNINYKGREFLIRLKYETDSPPEQVVAEIVNSRKENIPLRLAMDLSVLTNNQYLTNEKLDVLKYFYNFKEKYKNSLDWHQPRVNFDNRYYFLTPFFDFEKLLNTDLYIEFVGPNGHQDLLIDYTLGESFTIQIVFKKDKDAFDYYAVFSLDIIPFDFTIKENGRLESLVELKKPNLNMTTDELLKAYQLNELGVKHFLHDKFLAQQTVVFNEGTRVTNFFGNYECIIRFDSKPNRTSLGTKYLTYRYSPIKGSYVEKRFTFVVEDDVYPIIYLPENNTIKLKGKEFDLHFPKEYYLVYDNTRIVDIQEEQIVSGANHVVWKITVTDAGGNTTTKELTIIRK